MDLLTALLLVFNCISSFHAIDKVEKDYSAHDQHFITTCAQWLTSASMCLFSLLQMTAKSVGDGLALSEQVFLFLKQFSRHHSPIIFAAKETSGI